ncbi:MAG TPA: 3-methyl-2-oxobutanoate hydroxymethyltransferase [Methylophilaceae bacterium]
MNALSTLHTMKQRGEKIAMLTCYDASFAAMMETAGVDVLLVGDMLGVVIQGASGTQKVTMQDMLYHTRCVAAGSKSSPIVADMPYASDTSPELALANAKQLIAAGAHMVKLEGGKPEIVRHLVANNIPVCGHLGFTPQSISSSGSYPVQGKDAAGAQQILEDALAMQQAGMTLLVLSMLPANVAADITRNLNIPTIGIGAGKDCDGQVLVLYDMLGISPGKITKYSRNFLEDNDSIKNALIAYGAAVKAGSFPDTEHSF